MEQIKEDSLNKKLTLIAKIILPGNNNSPPDFPATKSIRSNYKTALRYRDHDYA